MHVWLQMLLGLVLGAEVHQLWGYGKARMRTQISAIATGEVTL